MSGDIPPDAFPGRRYTPEPAALGPTFPGQMAPGWPPPDELPQPFPGGPRPAVRIPAGGGINNAVLGIGAAVALVVVVIVLIAFSAGGGGCSGGRDFLDPPSYSSTDNVHWQMTYTCNNGGTKTVPVPSNQVPGGG